MTFSNPSKAAQPSGLVLETSDAKASLSSLWKAVFFGPAGLRAGWRLLIFLAIAFTLLASFVLIRAGGVRGFLEDQKNAANITITPFLMGGSEAVAFLILCIAALVMGRIEHRKFDEYGLPWRRAFRTQFWIGCLAGFSAISGTLGVMFLLHGFRITGIALHGAAIVYAVVSWGIAFILVGLFEEFLCRGYVQYTLASGIGFWPSALLVSFFFGFTHAFNPNETAVGALAAGLFGLLFCFFLKRTGNLWIAVGFHAAWDWGQMFYGVPDSGIVPYHNVFNSVFSGPRWLAGGSAGPEASILTPIALIVAGLVFSRYDRTVRYSAERPRVRNAVPLVAE